MTLGHRTRTHPRRTGVATLATLFLAWVTQASCGPPDERTTHLTLTGSSPEMGSIYGLTPIVIRGTGFAEGLKIQLGGADCAPVEVVSDLEARCLTPAHALGPVGLHATLPDGQEAEAPGVFTYARIGNTEVWANEGGDKVTRDEQRVRRNGPNSVINSVWDGTTIKLFGAKNEVLGFNVVIEGPLEGTVSGVKLELAELTGPDGAKISSVPVPAAAAAAGVFNWTERPIELFYMRYLQIKGLSQLSYETYDERHVPRRFRRRFTGEGAGVGTWTDRPDHDKFYPDIAVPLEVVGSFAIAAASNQSVFVDIYIPKTAPAGVYSGTLKVQEGTWLTHEVPVQLRVRDFALPDQPAAKTMLLLGDEEVANRYTGTRHPTAGSADDARFRRAREHHFRVAHRHKISLIDSDDGDNRPGDDWLPRLDGSAFTASSGYDGPGVGVGNNVYSIGTYGSWSWKGEGQAAMNAHTDAWENWFASNAPLTERFLYLIDESLNYAETEQWASWVKQNPGPGKNLATLATINLRESVARVPSLTIPTTGKANGDTDEWQGLFDLQHQRGGRFYMYNGTRPFQGSWCTEDDGVALRELAWGQYKKKIDRWFFWESTYYNDFQGGRGETNVFRTAATFSGTLVNDPIRGESGFNHTNGDGVLFYPGTDKIFPAESYGLDGPIASLRLKLWRRGIQDVDYLALANAISPIRTLAILTARVPKVMWDYGVTHPDNPTYTHTDISWSVDPDDWESARAQLADIIDGH